MVSEGLFTPDNPFQRASFIAVFLPVLQQVVDEYVGVWNMHLVRQINGNGRFCPSHCSARYFREYERLHGWVLKNLNSFSYFRTTMQFPTTFEEIDFLRLGGFPDGSRTLKMRMLQTILIA